MVGSFTLNEKLPSKSVTAAAFESEAVTLTPINGSPSSSTTVPLTTPSLLAVWFWGAGDAAPVA